MKERLFLSIVLTFFVITSIAQLPHGLKDGREGGYCEACNRKFAVNYALPDLQSGFKQIEKYDLSRSIDS